jgi:hypothetical protein
MERLFKQHCSGCRSGLMDDLTAIYRTFSRICTYGIISIDSDLVRSFASVAAMFDV